MKRRLLDLRVLMLVAALPLLMAHGHGGCGCGSDSDVFGDPTGAVCPSDSTLTWDSFGRAFMAQYCTRCHDSNLTGTQRNGAPRFHDFDTALGVQQVMDHVDLTAASGPNATNSSMPPDDPFPTMGERVQLGEWIACGAP